MTTIQYQAGGEGHKRHLVPHTGLCQIKQTVFNLPENERQHDRGI